MTAPTERRRDAKAGFCSMCRGGTHALCSSPTCTCTAKGHPNRPAAGPARASVAADVGDVLDDVRARARASAKPATNGTATKARLAAPVWELVKADPPAPPPKPHKPTAVERARPLLEQLMAEGSTDWHRLALFPSSMAAGQTRGRIAKAYREFEFKAVRVPDISQSAIYVRWTGEGGHQL